ncbi:MAG: undecaprenyl-diphosphatase [Thermoleophilaceae bacterium]|nr:undecaprenyl-diphosphatase [Thermoleophilaceae bacterium]
MALPARTAPPRRGRLSVRQAVALGLIQGPAELLPVSSSGHLVLVPAVLDWPYARLPADIRKAFEVALHTGAGLALVWLLRDDAVAAIKDPARTARLAAPAAVVALALEPTIEKRLSSPNVAATAQIAAGAALAASNHIPKHGVPGWLREFLVGLAQIAALVPGVSRNGATLTAARAVGLDREASARMSWQAGLPIIGGATVLKLVRLSQSGLDQELRTPFAAGAAAAFASTLVAAPLLRVRRQRWVGAYRIVFGALALRRLHRLEWPRG